MNEIPIFKFAIREDLQDTGNLFLPSQATPKATGWDVKAAFKDRGKSIVAAGQHIKIPLGFRTFAPEGWWYELKPRSSTFGKKNLHSLYGTIDEDYEGELIFAAQYLPMLKTFHYFESPGGEMYDYMSYIDNEKFVGLLAEDQNLILSFGEAIGQIIPVKRQNMQVECISNTEYEKLCQYRAASRGAGGFGSTDKKDLK